jgi:urea transport system permease protein
MTRLFGDRLFTTVLALLAACIVVLAALPGVISPYLVNASGQLAAFALLAVSLDLIWGYAGVLSLGHGLYFALGGYLVAMHLLKHAMSVTGKVPDFMQFMGWSEFPFYWSGFEHFGYVALLAVVLTVALAGVFGFVAFRSRVSGVYFSIITQALVYVAMLLMFRNDTGFGGNNGMTGFSVVFGFDIADPAVTRGLAAASLVALVVALLGCRALVTSRFGRLVIACRDDEARLRSLGYATLPVKLGMWCLSAVLAAVAGFLYVPQVGIINPRVLSPDLSLEIAVWVAIGGRGALSGAVIGAVLVNGVKFWLSSRAPELWPFILSGLVVLVVLVFPNGLLDLGRLRPRLISTRSGVKRA